MQQLSTEREERERERWSLLRHARDEAERSLSLAAQLEIKEQQLQQLQEQLQEVSVTVKLKRCVCDYSQILCCREMVHSVYRCVCFIESNLLLVSDSASF